MESKLALQEVFFFFFRKQKTPVTVFMTNGFQQRGTVAAFDGYTILMHNEGRQYFVYKHAISTIVPQKNIQIPQE